MIEVLLEREKSRNLTSEVPAVKISDLDLKLPLCDSIDIVRAGGVTGNDLQLQLLLVYELDGELLTAGWEVVSRSDGEPTHTYISDSGSSAVFVTYLPSGWDGSPYRAKQSAEYRERDDEMTDEEWEEDKANVIECGEGDLVPDPEGGWLIRLGTEEDIEAFEKKEAAERARWERIYAEQEKKEMSELAALMRE
jgi:hypothetical protein